MLTALEWAGAAGGAIGALLLACNSRFSGYGFVLFLLSNAAWMAYGVLTGTLGLVAMQTVCTGTSLLGIWRWLVLPRLSNPVPATVPEEPFIPPEMVCARLARAGVRHEAPST